MAFTTGTATDYHDLLDKLRAYLLAQGWTIDSYVAAGSITAAATLLVTGPGNIGGQQPKVGIQTESNTVTNAYGWKIGAYPQYDSARSYGLQDQNSPLIYYNLWQNTIDYWFYVNDTRFIVVAKIGTYYVSMYAGFFLPYALPTEYPYPYFIGASYNTLQPYNLNNAGMRSFCDPGTGAAYYMSRSALVWEQVANSFQEANSDDAYGPFQGGRIWPYGQTRSNATEVALQDMSVGFFLCMRPPVGGKMPMYQCQLLDSQYRVVPGALDGVFAVPGFNRVSEQTIVEGGTTYRLFIQQNRNTPKGFFAVEEV